VITIDEPLDGRSLFGLDLESDTGSDQRDNADALVTTDGHAFFQLARFHFASQLLISQPRS
jgi:hypothetical protein